MVVGKLPDRPSWNTHNCFLKLGLITEKWFLRDNGDYFLKDSFMMFIVINNRSTAINHFTADSAKSKIDKFSNKLGKIKNKQHHS